MAQKSLYQIETAFNLYVRELINKIHAAHPKATMLEMTGGLINVIFVLHPGSGFWNCSNDSPISSTLR